MADSVDPEEQLVERIGSYHHDPLGYVMFAFPWGEPGTPLEKHSGPRKWQREVLEEIGAKLRAGGDAVQVIQEAIASGHGVGKTGVVGMLIMWAMSTFEDTRGVVTANTDTQLRTKTWAELAKWKTMAINSHWFHLTATSMYSTDREHERTWRVDAIAWSETNTEAFAGLHNQGKRLFVFFDEASAIDDKIWEVTEGALTDEGTEIIWGVFGNYTRSQGRFHECFGRFKHRWHTRQIDSRTVEGTNKAQIQKWIDDYGEEHDLVRVRVRALPPRAGTSQLISSELTAGAVKRPPVAEIYDPMIVGVDVARFGTDQATIYTRRGYDARSFPAIKKRGLDTMQLAAVVAEHCEALRQRDAAVDMIFVDATGIGAGVADRLRQLGYRCIDVNFGGKSDGPVGHDRVHDKAAEMWVRMREWLRHGAIEDDVELRTELEGREYGYDAQMQIQLERKDDMRERGLSSPDCADGLALTFAYPVAKRGGADIRNALKKRRGQQVDADWNPYADT